MGDKIHVKKLLVALLLIFLPITACRSETIGWKEYTYRVMDLMIMYKVPNDWVMTQTEDGVVYSSKVLSDPSTRVFMLQIDYTMCKDGVICFISSRIGTGSRTETIDVNYYSNNTVLSKNRYEIGQSFYVYREIIFGINYSNELDFLVVDNSISDKTLKSILGTSSIPSTP